jgi:phosphonate transport system permease protein
VSLDATGSSASPAYPIRWRRPPQILTHRGWRIAIQVGALIWLVLALSTVDVNWARVSAGWERGMRFVAGFLQPDFTSRWTDIRQGLMESLTMTLTSTVVGVAISIPIGIGAARNLAPRWIYMICRGIIAMSRALQEIIVAIFFVAMFGFGPFAGFLTLTFATIGFMSKLLAEDIEDIDESQAEAIRATGAGFWQVLELRIQPQVMPRLIGLSALPAGHQFPRKRGHRHRRSGWYRGDAEHGHGPLRVRQRRRDSADHHRHRDGRRILLLLRSAGGAMMPIGCHART